MGLEGLVPPIVTRAEWEAAQASRTKQPVPTGATTEERLLLGVCRCSGCRKTLKVVRRRRADGSYVYSYFCKDASTAPCPRRAFVHCHTIEKYVTTWFKDALKRTPKVVDIVAAQSDLETAMKALKAAEDELGAFVEETAALNRELFRKGIASREKRVEAAQRSVRELSARVSTLPAGGPLARLWDGFGPAERREVLQGFLDRVEVDRGASGALDGHVRIYWADGTLAKISDEHERAGVAAA
jgi:hypothetical protein